MSREEMAKLQPGDRITYAGPIDPIRGAVVQIDTRDVVMQLDNGGRLVIPMSQHLMIDREVAS